jgi:hypothetical protein
MELSTIGAITLASCNGSISNYHNTMTKARKSTVVQYY